MTFGGGGLNPIALEAARRMAMAEHDGALATSLAAERRAELDEQDLRDTERAIYGEPAVPPSAAPTERRSFLDRLLGRRR